MINERFAALPICLTPWNGSETFDRDSTHPFGFFSTRGWFRPGWPRGRLVPPHPNAGGGRVAVPLQPMGSAPRARDGRGIISVEAELAGPSPGCFSRDGLPQPLVVTRGWLPCPRGQAGAGIKEDLWPGCPDASASSGQARRMLMRQRAFNPLTLGLPPADGTGLIFGQGRL